LVPVWMMWALNVSRSMTAVARRGSVKVAPHSENGCVGGAGDGGSFFASLADPARIRRLDLSAFAGTVE
jgi:hypothetical protein